MEQWSNYFIAAATAAATLTGLIFVSVSFNLTRILAVKYLPARALGSLILLGNILFISSFCLIPGQSPSSLGYEILAFGIMVVFNITRMDVIMYGGVEKQFKRYFFQNAFFTQIAVCPFLIAGALLIAKSDAGFYWLVPGVTFSFIKSLLDSWVLLVEIHR
jgi:modulator of FtsH protease